MALSVLTPRIIIALSTSFVLVVTLVRGSGQVDKRSILALIGRQGELVGAGAGGGGVGVADGGGNADEADVACAG